MEEDPLETPPSASQDPPEHVPTRAESRKSTGGSWRRVSTSARQQHNRKSQLLRSSYSRSLRLSRSPVLGDEAPSHRDLRRLAASHVVTAKSALELTRVSSDTSPRSTASQPSSSPRSSSSSPRSSSSSPALPRSPRSHSPRSPMLRSVSAFALSSRKQQLQWERSVLRVGKRGEAQWADLVSRVRATLEDKCRLATVLRTGWLLKKKLGRSISGWKKRWCVLDPMRLWYFEKDKSISALGSLELLTTIPELRTSPTDVSSSSSSKSRSKVAFVLHCDDSSYLMASTSNGGDRMTDVLDWVRAIQEARSGLLDIALPFGDEDDEYEYDDEEEHGDEEGVSHSSDDVASDEQQQQQEKTSDDDELCDVDGVDADGVEVGEPHHDTSSSANQWSEKRSRVLREFIATERSYVKSLQQLHRLWINPMKESGLLTENDISTIFGNILLLSPVSEELADHLEEASKVDPQDQLIGPIFSQMSPYFRMYKEYCSNQAYALDRLATLQKESRKLRDLASRLRAHPDNSGTQALSSFLIMPLQRLCRWPLLLSELCKCTPEHHNDHAALQGALETAETLAREVNERKRQSESQVRLLALQMRATKGGRDVLSPGRLLVGQVALTGIGTVSAQSTPDWLHTRSSSPCEAFVCNDVLLLMQHSRKRRNALKELLRLSTDLTRVRIRLAFRDHEDVDNTPLVDLSTFLQQQQQQQGEDAQPSQAQPSPKKKSGKRSSLLSSSTMRLKALATPRGLRASQDDVSLHCRVELDVCERAQQPQPQPQPQPQDESPQDTSSQQPLLTGTCAMAFASPVQRLQFVSLLQQVQMDHDNASAADADALDHETVQVVNEKRDVEEEDEEVEVDDDDDDDEVRDTDNDGEGEGGGEVATTIDVNDDADDHSQEVDDDADEGEVYDLDDEVRTKEGVLRDE